MKIRSGLLIACVTYCLGFAPATSPTEALASTGEDQAGGTATQMGDSLVIPGALTEPEQLQSVDQAALANPESIVEREASSTEFESITPKEAARLAAETFPAVIDKPSGGLPQLPSEESVTKYPTDNAAQVDLGNDQSALIESLFPIAIETTSGRTPVDLGLTEVADAFEPTNPLVEVRIPKRLDEGVQAADGALSLTPVDAHGVPLTGSQGARDGATVFFGETQTDADTIVKPSSLGFAVDTLLRSQNSPQQLHFRVDIPDGAHLVQASDESAVQVVEEGATIATVPIPHAHDADGSPVPVSMTASANTLTVGVAADSETFRYPIDVDPEFNVGSDKTLSESTWVFVPHGTGLSHGFYPGEISIGSEGTGLAGQWGELYYQTTGDSHIYQVNTETSFEPSQGNATEYWLPTPMRFYLEYEGSGGYENSAVIATQFEHHTEYPLHTQLCPSECLPTAGREHNLVRLAALLTENGGRGGIGMKAATVAIAQPKETHATIHYNVASPEVGGTKNVFYGGENWLSSSSGALEFKAEDAGIGIAEMKLQWNEGGNWLSSGEGGATKKYLGTSSCAGIQCAKTQGETLNYANLLHLIELPNGEEKIRIAADDALEHTWSYEAPGSEITLKVDKAAPHALTVSGLSGAGENLELGEVEEHIKAEATDGEGTVPSAGVKSIALAIDGKAAGTPQGSCPRGPCTASGEWPVNGAELGVGIHTLTIVATDKTGNVESKHYTLTVHGASPVAMGPGSVNPESGDFALGTTDVTVSGGAGTLAVTRHYDSRDVTEGAEGPLGPQWSLSLGSLASLEVLSDKSVMVVGPEGLTHFPVKAGGGLEAPNGDKNLTLELKGSEYLLKDKVKGTTTKFTLPAGAKSWMPTVSEGPVATNTMTDTYASLEIETGKTIIEPKLELAPHSSASCPAGEPTKWERGCRGLEFVYGTTTSASGEDESEWGEYKNRLMQVLLRAYNPATKAIETKKEAEYAYDKQGRLRAEWDPEVQRGSDCSEECRPLKVMYGYDSEEHITALTPPGQETWAFAYGTTAGDSSAGRLVKVMQAPVSAGVWNGHAVSNTWAPSMLRPYLGVKDAVSLGNWSNSPVAYAYQWEHCELVEWHTCTPITGATNQNYTPTASDMGWRLGVKVTATNGGGSVTASATSEPVAAVTTSYYTVPDHQAVVGVAPGPDKNMWYAEREKPGTIAHIGKMTTAGAATEYGLPPENQPSGDITAGPDGDVWFTESNDKIGKITTAGASTFYTLPIFSEPSLITAGLDGNLWFIEKNKIGKITTAGKVTEYTIAAGTPRGIAAGPDKNVWFTAGTSVDKITTAGAITEYPLAESAKAGSIAAGPDGNLWFADGSKMGKITTAGAITTYALPAAGASAITSGPLGALWYKRGNGIIAKITTSGQVTEYPLQASENAVQIASGPDGDLWFNEAESERIRRLNPTTPEGVAHSPEPGSTIEYGVPLSGSGAPDQLSEGEVAKWGQKDDPAYATAIFPPDEPEGWPASDYKRATITYLDKQARMVNVAAPSGGVSTREYNAENAITRSLSADNRATALLNEKTAPEVSKLLDTTNAYNAEGQLTDTWGPQHSVKLAKGKEGKAEEALARNHIRYFYDEGAKEVEATTHETYELVTKTEDGAETASKEEFDKRAAVTSYSGQSNLGWKLRAATSVTTDPGGLNLTTSTKYDESTGNVVETESPAGNGGDAFVPASFSSSFGSLGSASGNVSNPTGDAIDASGDVWVVDTGNNRVDEFGASGAFLKALGFGVSDGKETLEVCTSSCRSGLAGSGAGQFNAPWAIAVSQSNGNVYVTDGGNSRIEEFSSAGALVAIIGGKGSGEGQLLAPTGVALDPSGDVWVADSGNNRVEEFSAAGTFKAAYGKAGSGNLEFNAPRSIAVSGGNLYIVDSANNRIQEISATSGAYVGQFGGAGTEAGKFNTPVGITANPASGNLYVSDSGNYRVEEFSAARNYITQFGAQGSGNGQLSAPEGIASDALGDLYVVDSGANERVQRWVPAITGNPRAHEGKTIYYTAKTEAEAEVCWNHPEWAGLPCETKPVAQPGGSGPEMPVTVVQYNLWNQPETSEETFGTGASAKMRVKKGAFDAAGRPEGSEETSSVDLPLPKVTEKYSSETGASVEERTTVGESAKTIKSAYNKVGAMTEYTDAAGNTATYEYEPEKDERLLRVADAKGSQTYHYDETTGNLSELVDSAAGVFKAAYDVGNRMTTETYPNAMTASFKHNPVGQATSIEYAKTTHCAKACPEVWFSDAIVASVHGEVIKQASTLSEEPNDTYDAAGRLTQVQEVPSGGGCTTRSYAYDEENNRATETTSQPGAEGKCVGQGGTTEWHTYDTANRLTDPGVTYDTFGNTTKLPAADADGSELISEYYVDNQVAKQEQSQEAIEYKLDPEGRTLETISSGNTSGTALSHYDGAGGALAWTSEGSGESQKWTRNIPGMGGALTGIETGEGKTGGAVVLQLHDLQGNVVGEASDNEAETKLLKTYNSTEFGVPSGKGAPPKYAWLGAAGVAGELPSGVITQDGVTYVPQTGRPLQTEGVALIAIGNGATPFTRSVEAWVGSMAGDGAARELAAAEQERAEREAANKPAGETPVAYPTWWCGGEYGPCEEEAGGGSSGGGCAGMNACAASRHNGVIGYSEKGDRGWECSIWGSWGAGEVLAGEISGWGHWECGGVVAGFEMRIAAYAEIEGTWYGLGEGPSRIVKTWSDKNHGSFEHTWKCPKTGAFYHLWFWGFGWGGHSHWSASGWERRIGSCTSTGVVDMSPVGQAGEPG